MRGLGFWGSHPGLRRYLCVLLTIGLIVGSFTCFINADEYEEDEQEAAVEQVEVEEVAEVEEESKEDEAVVEEADDEAAEEAAEEADEEAIENAVEDQQAVDEEVAENQDKVDAEEAEIEDVAEEADVEAEAPVNQEVDLDIPEQEVSVEADMVVESNPEVLIWTYYYSEAAGFADMIKGIYENEGYTAAIKKDTEPLTAAELKGVKLVYLLPWYKYPSDDLGKAVIASADVLKSFVTSGGRVVMNGERSTSFGLAILEQLGSNMGFDFDITGDYSSSSMLFNSAEKGEYADKISGFKPSAHGQVITSDADACWIIRDSSNRNIMIDRRTGDGYIIIITDINWLTYSSSGTVSNLLTEMVEYHGHILSLTASDDELTAKCIAGNCDSEQLINGITITIVAPEKTVIDDGKSEAATLSGLDDFNTATGLKVSEGDILYTGTGSTSYAESSTAPTAAGSYKATVTVGGATASVEYEIEPVKYSFDDSAKSWTKDSTETLSFRASRNSNDDTTIDHFAGAKVDNKTVEEAYMNVTKGSVVVELKAEFLNTLDVGTHTITFSFDDGDDISMSFTVKAAPKASPQTGEYSSPAVLVMAAVLLAGSAVAGVKVFKKKEEC